MAEKLMRRYLFSKGSFRIFSDPPTELFMRARFYQLIGGKRWSISLIRHSEIEGWHRNG